MFSFVDFSSAFTTVLFPSSIFKSFTTLPVLTLTKPPNVVCSLFSVGKETVGYVVILSVVAPLPMITPWNVFVLVPSPSKFALIVKSF